MKASKVEGEWPDIDGDYLVEVRGDEVSLSDGLYFRTEAAAIDFMDRVNRPSPSVPAPGPLSVDGRVLRYDGMHVMSLAGGGASGRVEAQLAVPEAVAALGPCPPWAEYGIVATGEALRGHGEGWERKVSETWLRGHDDAEAWTYLVRPCQPEPEPERVPALEAVRDGRTFVHKNGNKIVVQSVATVDGVGLVAFGADRCHFKPLDADGMVEVLPLDGAR